MQKWMVWVRITYWNQPIRGGDLRDDESQKTTGNEDYMVLQLKHDVYFGLCVATRTGGYYWCV